MNELTTLLLFYFYLFQISNHKKLDMAHFFSRENLPKYTMKSTQLVTIKNQIFINQRNKMHNLYQSGNF